MLMLKIFRVFILYCSGCFVFTWPLGGLQIIAISVLSVCLYVCLSACISQQPPHVQTSQNILYMLHVAMARSSFDDNEICYFFHFFVMTSYFHIMGHMVHTICSIDVSVVLQQRVRSFQRIHLHLHLPGYVRLRITRRLAHSGAWGTTLFDCVIVYNDSKLWTERKVCCLWCFLFLNGRLWAMAGIYQGIWCTNVQY